MIAHPRVRWRPETSAVADELEGRYDAVVHAVGSFSSRRLGIPGAVLPVRLNGPRAVIVGNGNVALDLARLLISDPRRLAGLQIPAAGRSGVLAVGLPGSPQL